MPDRDIAMDQSLESLRAWLADLPLGPVADTHRAELLGRLAGCWDAFAGGSDSRMATHKLTRAEGLEWEPPAIRFEIERHGGTVLGSIYAEVQAWTVDTAAATASTGYGARRRRLGDATPRLDVRPLADDLAGAILAQRDHHALKWSPGRRVVRLNIGAVIPDNGPKETIGARRKRLRAALAERLAGWEPTAANRYEMLDHDERGPR